MFKGRELKKIPHKNLLNYFFSLLHVVIMNNDKPIQI